MVAEDYSAKPTVAAPLEAENQTERVERVIDGDTFKLSNGQNLKLAGINAPGLHDAPTLTQEAKKFRKEIWAYRNLGVAAMTEVESLLKLSGNQIQLQSDGEGFDDRGNLLAHVYVLAGQLKEGVTPDEATLLKKKDRYEIFVNAYLVKLGLAEVLEEGKSGPYGELFLRLEEQAKQDKKGLWEESG
ncbi:MAG: thermonuclease family protein [Candidatus Omnitrophica bacterium]|nr:thermonuclease family protein [Candidatus Omnitrophota bacterium]